ncbi:unnamed protein product [Gongylonema pulchrum]|uniref:Uncharacterized protein n=1 Tax=Gongylonema pulchrum TaxID=637853 RepID=A0A3P7NQW2_9BILA|nr:unnamed protein product [Gongylonema pulchrum]
MRRNLQTFSSHSNVSSQSDQSFDSADSPQQSQLSPFHTPASASASQQATNPGSPSVESFISPSHSGFSRS